MGRIATGIQQRVRRLSAVLGNEGALANAGTLQHERQRERWQVAALERALRDVAAAPAASLRRPA